MNSFLAWALSSEVTGAVTWLGTIAGLIGITLTWLQSRAARLEAEKATAQASMATQAVRNYERRLALSGLAESRVRLHALVIAIRDSNFAVARVHCDVLLRDLTHVLDVAVEDAGGIARRSLNAISKQVDRALGNPSDLKQSVVDKAASGLGAFLVTAQIAGVRDPKRF